jgi:hypothetical protein
MFWCMVVPPTKTPAGGNAGERYKNSFAQLRVILSTSQQAHIAVHQGYDFAMPAVIIADLIRDRRMLWVYCRECGRERDVNPATLPLPGECPGAAPARPAVSRLRGPHSARN